MPIDVDIVGTTGAPATRSWNGRDCMLYAIGVGAGALEPAGFELEFTTENSDGVELRVLPTFATVIGGGGPPPVLGAFDRTKLLHGEQAIELLGPIPSAGSLTARTTVTAVLDKGSGALVQLETRAEDAATGRELLVTRTGMFIRGEGGFGGPRGPSLEPLPARAADEVVLYSTRPDQALIYRLSGDRNPLHSDPSFAKRAGFARPILHGLCTYGFTGRALLHTLCGSDPARMRSMSGRFSRPTYPGDTLTVSMWVEGDGARFRTDNQRGETVIDAGAVTFAPPT